MISSILIYKTDSKNPYENLAREKYLFDTLEKNTFILYLWQNENTVVIGRNQNPWAECNCARLESEGGHLARRLTGGGAVFHDVGNLNFTFICNEQDYDITNHLRLIQSAVAISGIKAEISGRNDILTDGRKFSGNAFLSSNGKKLHHGTILISADTEKMNRYLTPSQEKLKAKGVKSVRSRVINLSEIAPDLTPEIMAQNMISAVGEVFSEKVLPCPEPDRKIIEVITKDFYDWDFRYGKTVEFSFTAKDKFPWGEIDISLDVKSGIISDAVMYTDSMDADLSDIVSSALKNVRLSEQDINSALSSVLPNGIASDILSTLKEQVL